MALIELDPVTITNGTSLSGPVKLGDKTPCGVIMPAAWTAAALTFQVSFDNGATWLEYFDAKAGSAQIAVAAGQYVAVDPTMFRGVNMMKLRSGTSASPVNQGAGAAISIVNRRAFEP